MSDQTEAAAFRSAVNIAGGREVDANLVATLTAYQSQGHRAGGAAPAERERRRISRLRRMP